MTYRLYLLAFANVSRAWSTMLAREPGERRIEIDANNALGTTARHAGDLATAFGTGKPAARSGSRGPSGFRACSAKPRSAGQTVMMPLPVACPAAICLMASAAPASG